MKINRQELETALSLVKPGLAGKEIIEQSTSFLFTGGRVVTYNDEISISHPVKGLDLQGAIRAEEFFKLIGKLSKDEIDLEESGNQVQLKSSRTKAGLTLQEEITLPLDSIGKKKKWQTLPEAFTQSLAMAAGACGRDMSRPILTCVYCMEEGKIIGSDSYKIMTCTLGEELPVPSFLLPAASAVEVVKINPTRIAEGDGWVHFKSEEGTMISCRLFEDGYPDTSAFETIEGMKGTFPKTFSEVLERVQVFAKRDHLLDESLEITIADNRMKIKAENDSGWIEEEMNMKHDGDPVDFLITPYLLKGVLDETSEFIISDTAIMFNGANWVYVSLLRNE